MPPDYLPLPAGRTAAFRLPAAGAAVKARRTIAGLRCTAIHPRAWAVHLELYAHRLVVPVPAGIGVAPPLRRRGAYVRGGACTYPVRSLEPTGLLIADATPRLTLGDLFEVWGQRLSRAGFAGFRGGLSAYVDGARWLGDPRAIPLRRHAEIVLEIGAYVPPHPRYVFPRGL